MITHLTVEYFRNLDRLIDLDLGRLNFIHGDNGSGKTSLLEALYYLVMGRSFRSHHLRQIISHHQLGFRIAGHLQRAGHCFRVGIERGFDHVAINRINGENVASQASIAALQPVQLLNYDSNLLLMDAGNYRRQFIDWGLFHQQSDFLAVWRSFERVLKQRNLALRNQSSIKILQSWESELAHYGKRLSDFRQQYLMEFQSLLQSFIQAIFPGEQLTIFYQQGWSSDYSSLMEALVHQRQRDLKLGYTTVGPQRADWQIKLNNGRSVRDIYSRGQQKLLTFGLQLIQGMMFSQKTDRNCLYLIDDPLAELDQMNYQLLINQLTALPVDRSQFFITGLHPFSPPDKLRQHHPEWCNFQLSQGRITRNLIG